MKKFVLVLLTFAVLFSLFDSYAFCETRTFDQIIKEIDSFSDDDTLLFPNRIDTESSNLMCGCTIDIGTKINSIWIALHANDSKKFAIWKNETLSSEKYAPVVGSICLLINEYMDYNNGGYICLFFCEDNNAYSDEIIEVKQIVYSPLAMKIKEKDSRNPETTVYYDEWDSFNKAINQKIPELLQHTGPSEDAIKIIK